MKRKNGFTLIELLAVVVILAIIMLITAPIIIGVIGEARINAYRQSLVNIFDATDLYVATHGFGNIPDEGLDVTSPLIEMKNKDFTSGKIIKNDQGQIELDNVSNGEYCGKGTFNSLIVMEGSCDSLDETPPTITISSGTITSSSITIVASADDPESGVSGYQFSKDDGLTWTSVQTSNVYTFSGLTNNFAYTFRAKVFNNNELSTISNALTLMTSDVATPTYSIDPTGWSQSKVVTIHYPSRQPGYVYEYSLDGASTWEEVAGPATTQEITFTENGSVIARILDGPNEISGANYEVTNIDTTPPVITVDPTNLIVNIGSTYTDSGVTASDAEMGDITGDIVVTGSVDTSTAGTYTLTYNVSDAAGNAATEVTRTVEVTATGPAMPASFVSPSSNVTKGATITVNWGDTSDWGIPDTTPNYRLEVQYDGGTWSLVGNTGTTSSRSHTVSSTNNTIRYRVRAESDGGMSDWRYSSTLNLENPIYTTTVSIPSSGDSSSRSQNRTITISNLQSIESISVNTGSVSYSTSGDNVTIYTSSGSAVRTYTPSWRPTRTVGPQTSTSFPYSLFYNSGGYSGTLYKDGGYYYDGSTTEYRTFDFSRYMIYDEYHKYTSSGWYWSYSDHTGNPGSSFYVSNGYDDWGFNPGGGWSGTMYSTGPSVPRPGTGIYYPYPPNPSIDDYHLRYREDRDVYYEGTLSRSESMYSQDYTGTVYGSTSYYYAYSVTITYRAG